MFPVLLPVIAGTLALTAPQQIDTSLAVARGQRLEVNSYGGEIVVQAWNRNTVRIEGNSSASDRLDITSTATSVTVRTQGRHGPPSEIQLKISAPAWMSLTLAGVHTNVRVAGSTAPISVETVEGEVQVTGGDGLISLRSVQGSVSLKAAKGRISVNSVNEGVEVTRCTGDITASTVNGEITLDQVDASTVDANTVNGDILYGGPIRNGGRYSLSTHNGDVTLTVAEGTNASVAVSTFNGDFESEFPVPISGTRKGKGFNFTLGNGNAQVTLESFQGTIQLIRPGGEKAREIERDRQRERAEERDHDHD
jgi:putative adhesin